MYDEDLRWKFQEVHVQLIELDERLNLFELRDKTSHLFGILPAGDVQHDQRPEGDVQAVRGGESQEDWYQIGGGCDQPQ